MFRLWGKIYKNNKVLEHTVVEYQSEGLSTFEKVDQGLLDICMLFDLQKPLWFKSNHKELEQFRLTTFRKDHFIEHIDFDYLELEIIEDDKKNL